MIGAGANALRYVIQNQFHRIAVGIYFRHDIVGQPIGEGVTCDVNHGVCGPVGFVEIKGILAQLPVISHQTLVIAPRSVALVAATDGEIKHVPEKFAPEE